MVQPLASEGLGFDGHLPGRGLNIMPVCLKSNICYYPPAVYHVYDIWRLSVAVTVIVRVRIRVRGGFRINKTITAQDPCGFGVPGFFH